MNRFVYLSASCLLLATSYASADVLATYDFNGEEYFYGTPGVNGGTQEEFGPKTIVTGLTASNTLPFGSVTVGSWPQTYPDNVLAVATGGTGQFEIDDYFSITVTPDPGQVIDFESITLEGARGGGSDRGFVVRSSVDGFTANLNGPETESMATQRPNLTPYTIDLTDPAFDAVDSAIEFRFYVFSTAPTNVLEFDNIAINGVVVPEPGSFTLFGAGLLVMLRRKR